MHCKDTAIEIEVDPEEPEILIMTCKVDILYFTLFHRTNCLNVFFTLFPRLVRSRLGGDSSGRNRQNHFPAGKSVLPFK